MLSAEAAELYLLAVHVLPLQGRSCRTCQNILSTCVCLQLRRKCTYCLLLQATHCTAPRCLQRALSLRWPLPLLAEPLQYLASATAGGLLWCLHPLEAACGDLGPRGHHAGGAAL